MSRRSAPTSQQRKFAELIVSGEYTMVDAYAEAYQVPPEQRADRATLSDRAYAASKTKGVSAYIRKLQEHMAVEEAKTLVWDKRRASVRLMKVIHEIETNVDITRELRDKAMEDPQMHIAKKLDQMVKVAQIDNDTMRLVKECILELNQMYGLTSPGVNLTAAVQVIIGGPEQLPDDTVDELPSEANPEEHP